MANWNEPETLKKYQREYQRRWRQANPEKAKEIDRRNRLKGKYGVTPEMFEAKAHAQAGLCAICKEPQDPRFNSKQLVVDHDHEYGRLRDLLCANCNCLLGYAKDDPDRLLEAASYLKKWKMKFLFGDSK